METNKQMIEKAIFIHKNIDLVREYYKGSISAMKYAMTISELQDDVDDAINTYQHLNAIENNNKYDIIVEQFGTYGFDVVELPDNKGKHYVFDNMSLVKAQDMLDHFIESLEGVETVYKWVSTKI